MCDERYVSHMVAVDGDGREADFLILLIFDFLAQFFDAKIASLTGEIAPRPWLCPYG